jgi:hypothetical protein
MRPTAWSSPGRPRIRQRGESKTSGLEDNWVKAAEARGMKDAKKVLADFRTEISKLEK